MNISSDDLCWCGHFRAAHLVRFVGYEATPETCRWCDPGSLLPRGVTAITVTDQYLEQARAARHEFSATPPLPDTAIPTARLDLYRRLEEAADYALEHGVQSVNGERYTPSHLRTLRLARDALR